MENSYIEKAVVTGTCGFIGKALVKYLVHNGVQVIAVDKHELQDTGCRTVVADITTKGAIDDFLDNKTVVFHLAARANVAESVGDPRGDFENTLCGHIEVLESVRKTRAQLIFPSTASIYDTSNKLPLIEKAYVKPTSPYAAAKAAGEAYCAAYHRSYGLNIKVARMFSVYGLGMNRFAIHDLIRKMQKNTEEIAILGDGNQIRDYLYIDDAIRGLVIIADNGVPGEDYNLASGIPVKIFDLAKQIATLMGKTDIDIVPTGKSFPGDVPKWYADITKIKSIGFRPMIDFEEGLKKTIAGLTAETNL